MEKPEAQYTGSADPQWQARQAVPKPASSSVTGSTR